jgi:hypothetical protein
VCSGEEGEEEERLVGEGRDGELVKVNGKRYEPSGRRKKGGFKGIEEGPATALSCSLC